MNKVQRVQKFDSLRELLHDVKDLIIGELSFAKGFVLRDVCGGLHFHVDVSFINDLVSIYIGDVLVLDLTQKVYYRYGFSSLLLVERCDINASDHFLDVVLAVNIGKYFSVSLFKIDNFTHIFISRRITE